MSARIAIIGWGVTLAAVSAFASPPALAAAPAASGPSGIPCSGVWHLNEELTRRTRSPAGPFWQFFEPWGKDGWMRMNTGELDKPLNGGEWHFEGLNNKPYQVFGGDPSLQRSWHITDHIVGTTRIREGTEADYSEVVFSKDCKRVTYYFPEGEDRHGAPGKEHYYNDIRVFDRIDPPATAAPIPIAPEIFGGWMLNRTASKLVTGLKDAETLVVVPWGNSGWIWNQLSGSPYQPEDLLKHIQRIECGAAQGATAIACKGPSPHMMLYWATPDAKAFPTYGSAPRQVKVTRVNDRSLEVAFFTTANAGRGEMSSVTLSADGRHLTVATGDDMRVYDRINADNWPSVAPS
jgi:hypothetical protein